MKSRFLLVAVSSFLVSTVSAPAYAANAGTTAIGVGGRWQIIQKEDTSIRMVSEKVDFYVGGERSHDSGIYDTVADFVFRNDGPATMVKMGFPEGAGGDVSPDDYKKKTTFIRFSAIVDGRKIKPSRQIIYNEMGRFSALWVKNVSFRAGQTRRVRVSYRSNLAVNASFPNNFISYGFAGAHWKGKVTSSILTVHFERPGTYLVSQDYGDPKPYFHRNGHKMVYSWKNDQVQKYFECDFGTTAPGWLSENGRTPNDDKPAITISVPGFIPSARNLDWAPLGIWRGSKTYIALQRWLEWVQKTRKLPYHYDLKSKSIVVQDGARLVSFSTSEHGDNFTIPINGNGAPLFVPAERLAKEFGATFDVRPRDHVLRFLRKPVPAVLNH